MDELPVSSTAAAKTSDSAKPSKGSPTITHSSDGQISSASTTLQPDPTDISTQEPLGNTDGSYGGNGNGDGAENSGIELGEELEEWHEKNPKTPVVLLLIQEEPPPADAG